MKFTKGIPDSTKIRAKITQAKTIEELEKVIRNISLLEIPPAEIIA